MTPDDIKALKFKFASHLSTSTHGETVYTALGNRVAIHVITPRLGEFEYGQQRREFRVGKKWYKSRKAFADALRKLPDVTVACDNDHCPSRLDCKRWQLGTKKAPEQTCRCFSPRSRQKCRMFAEYDPSN